MQRSLTRIDLAICLLIPVILSDWLGTRSFVARAATTYYVATTGSNSNPGTLDQPFATITHAVTKVAPGDTINVRGGVYYLSSGAWIGVNGTANARIVIQSHPGERAILDGSRMPADNDCLAIGGQYIDIKNFECRHATRIGINIWGGKHIQILGNTVHSAYGGGIGMTYSEMNVVTDIRVDSNVVYNNVLMNKSRTRTGGWGAGIGTMRASNVRITNNRVYENYGEGIVCNLVDKCVAWGNIVYDNYSCGMYMDNATNSLYERNLIYNTGNPEFFRNLGGVYGPASGIQMANETEGYNGSSNPLNNNTIRNNIVIGARYGFYYGSYQGGGGMKNIRIINNTFYKATDEMVHIDADPGHSNSVIANNLFYQVNGVRMTSLPPSLSGLNFHHNGWYGGSAGTAAGQGDVTADPQLVNPSGTTAADNKLRAGSPLLDRGALLSDVTTDYFGGTRPQGSAPDIGAHEWGSVPTSSPTPLPCPSPVPAASPPPAAGIARVYLPLVTRGATGSCS